jgi:hypothetical protein
VFTVRYGGLSATYVHCFFLTILGCIFFYRTEHRLLLSLLNVSIVALKEYAQGTLLIHSSIIL